MSEAIVQRQPDEILKSIEIHCARCPSSAVVPVVDETIELPEAWSELFAKGGDVASLKKKVELPNKWRALYVSTQQAALGYLCPRCASETSQYLLLELDIYSFLRSFGKQIGQSGQVDNVISQLAAYLNTEQGAEVIKQFLYFKPPPALGGKTGTTAPKALPEKKQRKKRKALSEGKPR